MTQGSGLFITFEGCEGCGKSTQARLLFNRLGAGKVPALLTQEPGGTELGDRVRNLLKTKRKFSISPLSELFLFAASRSQLVADVIRPALAARQVVICDRFTDSTLVYQGYGRGLDLKTIESVNDAATGGLRPDLTILLDTRPEVGLQRKHNSDGDRFEAEGIAFHKRIREGYLDLARKAGSRWVVIESGTSVEAASNSVWSHVLPLIEKKYGQATTRG